MSSASSFVTEPARSLPVYGEYDVVVVGGGLAASVSAAGVYFDDDSV